MACNSCNKGLTTINNISVNLLECNYTTDIIIDWKNKLICIKDNDLLNTLNITSQKLNSFLGIVLSALSYEYNMCYLKNQLDEIKPYIDKSLELTEC